MPHNFSVPFCNATSKKNKNLRFHRFPKKRELKDQWVKFAATREIILLLQRTHAFAQNTSARKITKLEKMEKARKFVLKKGAVPTISNGLVKNDLGVLL